MIVGLGIDLVETARLARLLDEQGERFEVRVFTVGELSDCRERKDRVQALAARFAAKEACMKALGTGWSEGVGFGQIEVVRAVNGRPELRLHGVAAERARAAGASRWHVSLTHQEGVAGAVVVLEAAEEPSPGEGVRG